MLGPMTINLESIVKAKKNLSRLVVVEGIFYGIQLYFTREHNFES